MDKTTIYDVSLFGDVSPDGELTQLWGEDALANAIKMWIASYPAEVIGDANRGGKIAPLLHKPMSTVSISSLKQALRDGLEHDFTPKVEILFLEVIPNYVKRTWIINLQGYCPDLKISVSVSETVKGVA